MLGLPHRVSPIQHVALTLLGGALLVLPTLGWAPYQLQSIWCVSIVGVLLLLGMMLQNLPILLLFVGLFVGSLFFPPLAVVAVGVAIYLIISRIAYLLEHLPIVIGGFAYYGLAALGDAYLPQLLDQIYFMVAPHVATGVAWYAVPMAAVLVVAGALDRLFRLTYRSGYTPMQVVTIALTAPAMLLLLILAIAGIGADVVPDIAPDFVPDPIPEPPADVPIASDGGSPELVEVRSHVRSNPDGIVENNLSYRGPGAETAPEPTGYNTVRAHVRTAPDGIVENNLSYRGPTPPDPAPPSTPPEAVVTGTRAAPSAGASASGALAGRRPPKR